MKTCKLRMEKSVVGMINLRLVFCQTLVYTDDIVPMADSERALNKLWSEPLKEVHHKKSQVMIVGRTNEHVEQAKVRFIVQDLE